MRRDSQNIGNFPVMADGREQLRLFIADLDAVQAAHGKRFRVVLPASDLERASRFRTERLKNRFLASHYLLVEAVAQFTGKKVDISRICFPPFEKPVLPESGVHFSLSRSGPHAAVGICRDSPTGVDIEEARELTPLDHMAERVLSPDERTAWAVLDAEAKARQFLRFWRLKEAILKTSGEGLSRDPREISLVLNEGGAAIARLPASYGSPDGWKIGECRPLPAFPEVAWAKWQKERQGR